jgi:hypothetical protein
MELAKCGDLGATAEKFHFSKVSSVGIHGKYDDFGLKYVVNISDGMIDIFREIA